MNVWQAVVAALEAESTDYVFGSPGGDLFYDALYDVPGIKPVLVREESAGPFMAMGYARISGKPGICFGSPGPGVTNLVSGLLEAWSACQPVIAIGCSAKRANAGMGAFQECDQIGIMRPITKWAERVTEPDRIGWVMSRAFALAQNGKPGPVYIDIPKDIGTRAVTVPGHSRLRGPWRSTADPERVRAAAQLLMRTERPVLIAGGGSVSSRAFAEVQALAERLHAPVMSTPCGRGIIPEDHPLAFGQVGLYFSELGERVYAESDLLMTIGSRNEDFQSGEQRFFPQAAKYVQIDIDPHEIGRNWVPDVPLLGDAKLVLQALTACLDEARCTERAWTLDLLECKRAYEQQVSAECADDSVPLKTKRVIRTLNQVFGKDAILVNENGSQDLWSYYCPYYKVLAVNACVAPGEQTCMGGGCSAALGAKLAAPDKDVVCPVGDGAFQMFMKELPTAVQHHAPVTFVLLNNFSLGWIKRHQKLRGDRFIATDFEVQPDFVKIAEANQCMGRRVAQPEEIRPALEQARAATRDGTPAVLEFIVDSSEFGPGFNRFYERLG